MLASKGTRFLTGDTMCCFDCELMPKLQHIRVAGEKIEVKTNQCIGVTSHHSVKPEIKIFHPGAFFSDFEIPANLVNLWSYIREMYQLDAFLQSNPADQVMPRVCIFPS